MFLEGFASAAVIATVNVTKATSAHARVWNDMRVVSAVSALTLFERQELPQPLLAIRFEVNKRVGSSIVATNK